MYIKLSFHEYLLARVTEMILLVGLTKSPEIIETLPKDTIANKQVRVPIDPAFNSIFCEFNPCNYDYYFNCKKADKATVQKAIELLKTHYRKNFDKNEIATWQKVLGTNTAVAPIFFSVEDPAYFTAGKNEIASQLKNSLKIAVDSAPSKSSFSQFFKSLGNNNKKTNNTNVLDTSLRF